MLGLRRIYPPPTPLIGHLWDYTGLIGHLWDYTGYFVVGEFGCGGGDGERRVLEDWDKG